MDLGGDRRAEILAEVLEQLGREVVLDQLKGEVQAGVDLQHLPVFSPGTQFSYSDSNYYLLGLFLEKVTGQPYGSYLQNRLLRPLGPSHTEPCPDNMAQPGHARGYFLANGARTAMVGAYPLASESFSAGEVCSTAADLVAWANDLASGRVVTPSTYKEMATPWPMPGEPYAPYGYGLMVGTFDGSQWVGHDGDTFGFSAFLYHFPALDLNVALCFNAYPATEAAGGVLASAEQAILAGGAARVRPPARCLAHLSRRSSTRFYGN